jgi:YD repeat-containing protein
VFRKVILILLVVFVWHCIQAPNARAQNANPCLATTTWWTFDPIPPGWFYFSAYPGTFVYVIAANTCPPQPKCPCNKSADIPVVGNPIFLASGDTYIDDTDVSLPGLGGGLVLRRRWNSVWPSNEITSSIGIFGSQWKSTYDERVFMGADNYLTYARGDGSYTSFVFKPSSGALVGYPSNAATAIGVSAGPTTWVVNFQNGGQRQFNSSTGMLTAIVDRNGNTTQLTYDASNRLTTVTDPTSRHLYFNYPNGSSYLVTSVTSDFGVSLSYSYDTNNRLTQVTKPDLTTITYTYNTQSQITQVTDSNGKILESHTYDSNGGRGLTSSQANGVNSMTVVYP